MSDSSPIRYKIILMILPVGVVIGTVVFMYMYFHNKRIDDQEHSVIVSHGLRVEDLKDMVDKFIDRIGERNIDTEQGRQGLRSAASMIEGRLGPQNVGFPVKKGKGVAKHGLLWKSLWVDVRGQKTPDRVIIAAVSFAGAGDAADANTTSTLMMIASTMARDSLARTVRFVFLPFDEDPVKQNHWIKEKCLLESEVCDGIVGIKIMNGEPKIGGSFWQVQAASNKDKAWWAFLEQGEGRPDAVAPSVWITHPVFSPEVWTDQRERRVEKTIEVAGAMATWLRRAAE